MPNKSSYEMALDHYCNYCAFKTSVCQQLGTKCPAYTINLMNAKILEAAAERMVTPLKSGHCGFGDTL